MTKTNKQNKQNKQNKKGKKEKRTNGLYGQNLFLFGMGEINIWIHIAMA